MGSKNTIFIDCQILQTDAFNRGMGKYSLSLLEALSKNQSYSSAYDVTLILNKELGLQAENEKALERSVPQAEKLYVDLPTNIAEDLGHKYDAAKGTLKEELAGRVQPGDIYLILAPFFVMFPAVFPDIEGLKKVSLVYDLIPYIVWHKMRIFPDNVYFKHYELFIEADALLTISEAVKTDLEELVGISPEKITSIDGGPFAGEEKTQATNVAKRDKPYILCISAPILHKNNDRAVRAFAQFNAAHDNSYELIFTSRFDEETQKRLKGISDNIVFTGNVSDQELNWLYDDAVCVFFPSLSEGLGMPVLEGVMHDKPVACSNIPVLMEISDQAFYDFNPASVDEMKHALERAVAAEDWDEKHNHYKAIIEKYSWDRSAARALEILTSVSVMPPRSGAISLYCKDPRSGSVASHFAELLYPSLSQTLEVQTHIAHSGQNSEPAYLPYIVEANKNLNSKPAACVVIGNQKVDTDATPTIRIAVSNRQKTLLSRIFSRDIKNADIMIEAEITTSNEALDLRTYTYFNQEDEIVKPREVMPQIMELLKQKGIEL